MSCLLAEHPKFQIDGEAKEKKERSNILEFKFLSELYSENMAWLQYVRTY